MSNSNDKNKNFIDIKMAYDEDKEYYDLSFTDDGDLERDESFDTSINCSLLTDGRADSSEVKKVELQRGTIVDLFTDNRNGSKLWLLEQARANLDAKNRARDYAKNALNFLIEKGFVKDIEVSSRLTDKGIALTIVFVRLNGVFDKYRYDAWNKSLYRVTG